jgi:uncharacterized protein (TIRG00374 family)
VLNPLGLKWFILLAIKVSISGSLLFYILLITPLSQIFETLARATPSFVLFAFALFGLERYIMAFQLKRIADSLGLGLSTAQVFRINFITSFYELFLPGSVVTGAIRWYKLSQLSKMKIPTLAAIGINRLVHLVVIILIGVACWMIGTKPKDTVLTGILFFFLLVAFLIVYSLFMNDRFFGYVLNRVEWATKLFIPVSLQNPILKLTNALNKFHDLSFMAKLEIFGLQLCAGLLAILGWFLLAQALMLPVSPITLAWIRSLITMLVVLPIHVAGLGIREGSLMVLLPMFGVTLDEALALSFLLFFMRICWGIIGGIFEGWNLLILGEKRVTAKQFAQ